MHDYHVHSNYSDGRPMPLMVAAAAEAGLDGVGFADHCNVFDRPAAREGRDVMGFHLHREYDRRRRGIDALREEHDVAVHEAVEVDYEPGAAATIAEFLDEAGFDYALGSVHAVDGVEVHDTDHTGALSAAERRAFVDSYYDAVVSLVDSELFDVVSHVDFVELNPDLRGLTTDANRERVVDALANSRTVPEINAGNVGEWGEFDVFNPDGAFLDAVLDAGLDVTVGSDAHTPRGFGNRWPALRDLLAERGVDPVAPPSLQ